METKVNVVLLGALLVTWATLTLAEPAAAIDADRAARGADGLAALEDAFATHRDDPRLARELAEQYLALDRPQLAIAALGAASADVRQEPATLHRLAEAYEATGRMDDALATAQLALARCARALGTAGASTVTPVPAHACSERTYAALDMHAAALAYMHRWGVEEVQSDPRARQAYVLAVRSARLLSASAE
ncbi:MAG: hypothetical protein RLO52_31430 [Sandaracinaceae bacterium]